MGLSLGLIAARHGCELHGDPDVEVSHVATLASAERDSISFLANRAYRSQLAGTRAGAVILAPADSADCPTAALVHPDPYLIYARVAQELHPLPELVPGVHPNASVASDCAIPDSCEISAGVVIGPGASVGERVFLGPNVAVGSGSTIGDDTRVLGGAVVQHDVRIGDRCLIHPGVVIGSDGFGNAREQTGEWIKVPQIGSVVIGDDVEIGANTTVDRGTIGDTVIGNGVRLDNQIQVAHNVEIGPHTAIAALTGISGSVRIGARCMIGGMVAINGHIEITDDVMLTAGSGVVGSIRKPGAYGGKATSVDEISKWRKNVIRYRQLDDMARRLARVEKRIARLEPDD